MDNFRLLSFLVGEENYQKNAFNDYGLYGHKIHDVIYGNKFQFVDERKATDSSPYITLMIGPNGTGKSTVLREVSKILLGLLLRKTRGKFLKSAINTKYKYRLEYSLGNKIVAIDNSSIFTVDGKFCELHDLPLPKKVVVNTLGVSDKFMVKSMSPLSLNQSIPYDVDFYEYIGTKSDNFTSSSYGFIQRALDLLVEAFGRKHVINNIADVFQYLGFIPVITVSYKVRNKFSLPSQSGELLSLYQVRDLESLEDLIHRTAERRKSSLVWVNNIISDSALMNDLLNYIIEVNKSDGRNIAYELNFVNVKETDLSVDTFRAISVLRKLKLMDFVSININKFNGNSFDLAESSSGEIQILVSFLSMASVIENGALVLIDEPEISLHPNWQMKYMDLIYKVFGDLKQAHFIIATHSHFLVSDLRPEASNVLSIKIEDGNVRSNIIDRDTFGLSAEDVLYNVFNIRTTRNYYLEMELREALHLISEPPSGKSKAKSIKRLKELCEKFDSLALDKHDPLNKIIEEIKIYINKNDKATKKML